MLLCRVRVLGQWRGAFSGTPLRSPETLFTRHMGRSLNYGPFWDPVYKDAYYIGDLKVDHALENYPHVNVFLLIGGMNSKASSLPKV